MFKWGASEQLVSPHVPQALATVSGLRKGKSDARETGRVLPIDDEAVDRTLPFLPQTVADMVQVQRFSGMRPQELCLLRPCDIDRAADVWIFEPSSHKTEHHDRRRLIPIGPKAQEILLQYLVRPANEYCFRPIDSEARRNVERGASRKTPVSSGNRRGSNVKRNPKCTPGNRYEVAAYRRAIHRACDRAFLHPALSNRDWRKLDEAQRSELKQWRKSHQWGTNRLRHATATMIRKRFDLDAARVILGHASANVSEIYAERDLSRGVSVARLIG